MSLENHDHGDFFSVKSLHFTKLRMIDRQQRSKPLLLKASTSCVPQIKKGRRNQDARGPLHSDLDHRIVSKKDF